MTPAPHRPFLVDLGRAPECCTNDALEVLHKAMAEEPSSDPWSPHPNAWVRYLVERFTALGLDQIAAVKADLDAWLAGANSMPGPITEPAQTVVGNWHMTEQELALTRLYLQHLPLESWALKDYALLVDYLVQRYLPEGVLFSAAEMLVVRATLLGKAHAKLGALEPDKAATLAESLPARVSAATHAFQLGKQLGSILEYGRLRACESVAGMSDALRHRLKWVVLDHQSQVESGATPPQALTQKLFDAFGQANLDWRRIAVTEAGEMHNQGLVASIEPGARVRRLEAYSGACPFCKRLDGRIFNVTTADDPAKDGQRDVWPGKTNQGRSASPFKRENGVLVERPESERWWPAAGTQHPHCRGQWHVEAGLPAGGDEAFQGWLERHLAQGRVKEEPAP